MKYIYLPVCVAAMVLCAYLMGGRVVREKCRADAARDMHAHQQQIAKTIGEINAETYRRDTADIRRWLREKYTIAD